MAIKRYRGFDLFPSIHSIDDDLAWIAENIYNPFRSSWTFEGQWVDPKKYDIVPRPEYKKTLIENKQKEIESLLKEKERLEEELKELKKDL
jgi:hypothetical protein